MPPKKEPKSSNSQEGENGSGESSEASTTPGQDKNSKDPPDVKVKLENGEEEQEDGESEEDIVVEGEEEETEESDDEEESQDDDDDDREEGDEDNEKTKPPKRKKRVVLNVYINNMTEDILCDPDMLKSMMSDNEVEIKEVKMCQEQNWILYGRIELEKPEDRDKAISLTGKRIDGKEIRVERMKNTMSDRLYAPDDCILFVRNLPKTITEEELKKLFPTSKDLRLPKKNGKSRGFAFLNFATRKEVEDLIKDRQSEELEEKPIKLGTYTSRDRGDNRKRHLIRDVAQNNVLFIGNLNYDTKEETVKKFFKSAVSVRILRFLKRKSGKSKGVGFIEFKSPEAAKNAYEQKNGVTIDDREIFLEYAESDKAASAGIGKPKKSPQVTNKTQSGKYSGESKSNTPNRQQGYRQGGYGAGYGASRYPNQIRSLLDVDPYGYTTTRYTASQLPSLLDFDEYNYYNGDYGFDSYMYDLQSRMGLESGLSSRIGLGRGQSGRLGMENRNYMGGVSSMDLGYGANRTCFGRGFGGIDRSRLGLESGGGPFNVGYGLTGSQSGYNNAGSNIFRNMDKKRYRSGPGGGNRSMKGKSGWPAK